MHQRQPVRAAGERHALGGLAALRPRRRRRTGVAEADQRAAAEVHDEERDLARPERVGEPGAEDVRGIDRRSILDRGEQLREIEPARFVVGHPSSLRGGYRRHCAVLVSVSVSPLANV